MGQGHRLPCPIPDRTRGHRALANDCSLALMFGTPSVLCQFCLLNLQVVLDERTTQPGYCCVLFTSRRGHHLGAGATGSRGGPQATDRKSQTRLQHPRVAEMTPNLKPLELKCLQSFPRMNQLFRFVDSVNEIILPLSPPVQVKQTGRASGLSVRSSQISWALAPAGQLACLLVHRIEVDCC